MSLERMFEDLEGRLAHLEAQEMRAGAEELARTELSQISLIDRLRRAEGSRVEVHVAADHAVSGPVADVGADWVLLGESSEVGPRAIIPLHAIILIEGLPLRSREAGSSLIPPRSLGSLLRATAQDRAPVTAHTGAGVRAGRIAGVGRDAFDLAVDGSGGRRREHGPQLVTIAMRALRVLAIV